MLGLSPSSEKLQCLPHEDELAFLAPGSHMYPAAIVSRAMRSSQSGDDPTGFRMRFAFVGNGSIVGRWEKTIDCCIALGTLFRPRGTIARTIVSQTVSRHEVVRAVDHCAVRDDDDRLGDSTNQTNNTKEPPKTSAVPCFYQNPSAKRQTNACNYVHHRAVVFWNEI